MSESESSTTTPPTNFNRSDSPLSFYRYPSYKPSLDTRYQLRRLSTTADVFFESRRDELLTSLQSLSLKIKILEEERKEAELNFCHVADQLTQSTKNYEDMKKKSRELSSKRRKNQGKSPNNHPVPIVINIEGKHYYSDTKDISAVLGQSTTPNHTMKSNLQNVITLLKNSNHQLYFSSKKSPDFSPPSHKSELSPRVLLSLEHYNKSSTRPSSVHSQTFSTTDNQCYSCMKRSEMNSNDTDSLSQRMETISEELGHLQRQYMMSSYDHVEQELKDLSFDTLGNLKLLQLILKDSIND